MADIVRMGDRRVREIIQSRKESKETSRLSKDWEWLKKQKSGFVPFDETLNYSPRELQEFLPDNAWKNQRCFIIGGGPSLKGFNFKRLDQELTIAINRSFESINPSIIFWMDYQSFYQDLLAGKFGEKAQKKYESSNALKVALNISGYDYPPDIYSIKRAVGQGLISISLNNGIVDGDNSGYAALNLAVCLGANPIYLLGFDMKGDGKGNQAWFHKGYEKKQGEGVYKKFIGHFKIAAPILKGKGIKVINLNPSSKMRCFPFGDINKLRPQVKRLHERKHLIKESKRKWIVISFYTRGTSYEDEIKKLILSLKQHNLPYHIYSFNPMGSWRANLNYKSACILKTLETYPNKDIVFVDADGIVRQDPILFDQLSKERKHNIAAAFHNYGPKSGVQDELLSGTLWLQNNGLTRGLIKLWHKIAIENPSIIHQRCLKIAIKQMKENKNQIKLFRMPFEYTCIFDYPRARNIKPVIEHFQASRRFRKEVGYGGPLIKGIQT